MQVLRRRAGDELRAAADALLRQERVAEALAAYRAALEADPGYAPAQAGMGRALFRLGRHEEALETLAQALALQPDPAQTGPLCRLMGRAALELGRLEAAAGHFESAVRLAPRALEALDHLALVRFRQQRYAAALELYERLLEITPDAAQVHANRGAALYYLGRLEAAVRGFERALSWTRRWKRPAAPWRRSATPIRGPARSRALRARSTSARQEIIGGILACLHLQVFIFLPNL